MKLLEIQQTLSNQKPNNNNDMEDSKDNKDSQGDDGDDDDQDMPPPPALDEDEDKDKDKTTLTKWNDNVPFIGGYLAGEELFSRQAEAAGGFEEEVVFMS